MSETLIKLLRVYLGDEGPNALGKFDMRIAMLPEVDDFYAYLRQEYHEDHIGYWLDAYEDMVRDWPTDPILYLNVATVCAIWSRELERDYVNSKSSHAVTLKEWLDGRDTDYREFSSMRHRAATCLEKIIAMSPELPPDMVARLLAHISDLRRERSNGLKVGE